MMGGRIHLLPIETALPYLRQNISVAVQTEWVAVRFTSKRLSKGTHCFRIIPIPSTQRHGFLINLQLHRQYKFASTISWGSGSARWIWDDSRQALIFPEIVRRIGMGGMRWESTLRQGSISIG